ncbi:MAG: methyltransferase domain-containing protein [Desulforhopalus sp.]|nr:methyltransferase domain-containing protein [Desulforhopalus sp.]
MQTTLSTTRKIDQLQPGAFTISELQEIREAIQRKYAAVSTSAAGYFKYAVGKEGAAQLGYPKELLETIPEPILNAFCGVGNPLAIEPISQGNHVLDFGCGAGFDVFLASHLAGANGRVVGLELSREMAERARANLVTLQAVSCDVMELESEELPFPDNFFDVVVSNAVINLVPNKPRLFVEIFRILKPGGRLQFADIILEKELPPHLAAGAASWSQ